MLLMMEDLHQREWIFQYSLPRFAVGILLEAQVPSRLRIISKSVVQRHGDCTTCLERGHEAEAHMESWVTGSTKTPPKWMKSKQKAENKRSAPKPEWFRNRQEGILDCLKTPTDNLSIELAKKEDKDSGTDTVCNGQVKGSKWWGSSALLKNWTIRAEIMANTKRLELGRRKPRSSKSSTEKNELVHKMGLERPVEMSCNHQTPTKIPATELDQLGSIKFTTGNRNIAMNKKPPYHTRKKGMDQKIYTKRIGRRKEGTHKPGLGQHKSVIQAGKSKTGGSFILHWSAGKHNQ
jgi:hypothetical protein